MTTPIFFTSQDIKHHTMIIGSSSRGKSVRLQAEAMRLGISYEELLRRLEPSEESKLQMKEREEVAGRVEAARMQAVRDAYWNATPPDHHDQACLHDAIVCSDLSNEPTNEMVKALFMMLPDDIIRSAISWGFSDTEVRERVYAFINENSTKVRSSLGLQ